MKKGTEFADCVVDVEGDGGSGDTHGDSDSGVRHARHYSLKHVGMFGTEGGDGVKDGVEFRIRDAGFRCVLTGDSGLLFRVDLGEEGSVCFVVCVVVADQVDDFVLCDRAEVGEEGAVGCAPGFATVPIREPGLLDYVIHEVLVVSEEPGEDEVTDAAGVEVVVFVEEFFGEGGVGVEGDFFYPRGDVAGTHGRDLIGLFCVHSMPGTRGVDAGTRTNAERV